MDFKFTVHPLDEIAMDKARKRQAELAKPPGSLGRLEELSIQLAGITGRVYNRIEKKHLLVFAADNGVRYSAYLQSKADPIADLMEDLAAEGTLS